ncbi:MAG TPA: hypothetical protein VF832_07165, partial [Longimicrobiales bacterium]
AGSRLNLFDDYTPTSVPHFRHISFFAHAEYIAEGRATPAQVQFDVARIDHFMSGPTARLKALVPGVTNAPYAIALTLPIPAYSNYPHALDVDFNDDMKAWYAVHRQYDIETAFLHNADGTRKTVKIWYSGPENNRWILNPKDPGNIAYQSDRLRRYMQVGGTAADGIFLDEVGPLNFYTGSTEYPKSPAGDSARRADLVRFMAALRAGLGPGKMLMINSADYTDPFYVRLVGAAGATHKEFYNNPFTNGPQRWAAVDQMTATGAIVEIASPFTAADYAKRADFPAGGYPSGLVRGRMLELASYYMIFTTPAQTWMWLWGGAAAPRDWLKAYEANLGAPAAARSVLSSGVDAVGQGFQVWQRPFQRGLVLVRPQLTAMPKPPQRYDDATAVSVSLPAGTTWHLLNADGSTTAPVTAVTLRNAEAAILVK